MLEKLFANYQKLIATTVGPARLEFEIRAAAVQRELDVFCGDMPWRSGAAA